MGRRGEVSVVGSFAVGLTLRSDRLPVAGETVLARDFDQGPGGKGSNQAVQVARMGGAVQFVGVIGDDGFGAMALELFAAEGVGTDFLRRTAELNTGLGFILIDAAGDNRILLDPGANARFTPDDVDAAKEALAHSDVVIAQLEIPVRTAAEAMQVGRAAGARTVLNPAPVRPLPPDVLANVDVLTPNQTEARILLGLAPDDAKPDMDICRGLLGLGVVTVVLTRGREGAVIVTREGSITVPAHEVDVVDSTGAGDAFSGTLAASLAEGLSLEAAVRRGAAAGALACTRLGVIPSLPRAHEVDALLAESPTR
jgi:ribokinase